MAWRRPSRSVATASRRAAIMVALFVCTALLHLLPWRPTWATSHKQSRRAATHEKSHAEQERQASRAAMHTEPHAEQERLLSSEPIGANLSESSRWGESWQCRNICYTELGFLPSDCVCQVVGAWYMWVCSKYKDFPIQTQFCNSNNCGGCHTPEPRPSPPPLVSTPAPSAPSSSTPAPAVVTPEPSPSSSGRDVGYHPIDERLLRPSSAEKKTFYMYRVQNDMNYPPENQNMANLAGAMWYLHNEIVNNRGQRRFGKTRIQRFKVTTRATQPLIDDGMNFGVRVAFDGGRCSGPWDCADAFARYGYFVGCNYVDQFPTAQWKDKVFYPDATWYSLPGKCSSRSFDKHTAQCDLDEPGGACDEATGAGNCTYSYASAGEISIDELEGISNFHEFAQAGGWEYDNKTDRGVHMSFWDGKYNATSCQHRLEHARSLFREKFIDSEDLQEPPCDFSFSSFYAHIPRRSG